MTDCPNGWPEKVLSWLEMNPEILRRWVLKDRHLVIININAKQVANLRKLRDNLAERCAYTEYGGQHYDLHLTLNDARH